MVHVLGRLARCKGEAIELRRVKIRFEAHFCRVFGGIANRAWAIDERLGCRWPVQRVSYWIHWPKGALRLRSRAFARTPARSGLPQCKVREQS